MGNIFKFTKNQLFMVLISFLIFILLVLSYTQTGLLEGLERGAVNFRFFLRDPAEKGKKIKERITITQPNPKARKDIIILGIDLTTIRKFADKEAEAGKRYLWPFPWNVHAKFTRYVGSGNPLAIFFDIMFVDPKPHQEEFADAMKGSRNVFLDYAFESEKSVKQYSDLEERKKFLSRDTFPVNPDDNSPVWIKEIEPPTPILSEAARGIGFANVKPDRDGINRMMPLVIKFEEKYYPSINLVLVMHYYGIEKNDVEIKMGDYIKLKNLPKEKMAKPNDKREILIPIDNLGRMDINFIGGYGSFTNYPYYYFYQNTTMKGNDSLKDKIVLVAAYSATGIAEDVYPSPYGKLYGIEHHANALNTILNQDFLVKLSMWQNIFILIVLTIILALTFSRGSIITSIVFSVLFSFAYMIVAYILFDTMNLVCIFATPLLQIIGTFTFITTFRVLTEQREKKFIKQTFSKFVSKSVVDELLKFPEKLKLGGEKKILTVLFSDIRGFTSISEKLTPELLVEHLNEYLEDMTDIVFEFDGTLDKYVGDEIMAFWGAPVPQDDHALRACRAAVIMMENLHKLNEEWIRIGKPPLNIGIGLNTGEMVVGNMGSSSRMDYTLMGDNVNLGARLEGTNKVYGTNIIISAKTYEHVKDHVIVRELDLIRVKGKELPVTIYELIAISR